MACFDTRIESLPNNCTAYSKKFFLDKNYSVDIIEKQYEIGFQIQMKIYRSENVSGRVLAKLYNVRLSHTGFRNYLLNNRKDIFIIWTDYVREKGLYL